MTDKQIDPNLPLVQGPIMPWIHDDEDLEQIETFLNHEDPVYQAYGEAYKNHCFVREFDGLTGVGEMDTLRLIRFRSGVHIEVSDLGLGDLVEMSYPGSGDTREERIHDGIRQVLEARKDGKRIV